MKKLMYFLLGGVAVLILILVFGLGYFGFLAPVSKILGTNEPKDLGVSYTEDDLETVKDKLPLAIKESSVGSTTRYEGQRSVSVDLTSAEVSALINSSRWAYTPIEKVQVKIGENGSVESSGVLRIDLLDEYLSEVSPQSVSQEELERVTKILPDTVPYYISGVVSYGSNGLSFNFGESSLFNHFIGRVYASNVSAAIGSLTVGRLNVPQGILSDNQGRVDGFLNTGLGHIKGLKINSLVFDQGKMSLDAKIPTVKYRPSK